MTTPEPYEEALKGCNYFYGYMGVCSALVFANIGGIINKNK